MNNDDLRLREAIIAHYLSISRDRVRASSLSDAQCDVHVYSVDGQHFRYGYFHDFMFWRENPVERQLRRYGINPMEHTVGMFSEPQYDIVIHFTPDGKVVSFSDSRSEQEIDFPWSEFEDVRMLLDDIIDFDYRNSRLPFQNGINAAANAEPRRELKKALWTLFRKKAMKLDELKKEAK